MSTVQVFDPENSPLSGLMLLEASAGTGKTYALERMVTRLIGRDESPLKVEEILVVTFTNRAAREMKERIRKLLGERAVENSRGPDEKRRYRAAISGFDSAPIYTIHGFCKMVLSTWPFESASPFRQEMLSGGQLESAELRSWIAGMQAREVNTDLMRTAYQLSGGMENLISGITGELVNDGHPPGAQVLPTREESEKFASLMVASRQPGSPLELAARDVFNREWTGSAMAEVVMTAYGTRKTEASLDKVKRHMAGCRTARGLVSLSEAMFGDPANSGGTGHFIELFAAALKIGTQGPAAPAITGETGDLVRSFTDLYRQLELCLDFDPEGEKPLTSLIKPYMRCAFSDIARKSVEDRLEKLKDSAGSWGYADLIRRVSKSVARPESPLLPVLRKRFRAALIDEFQDTDPRQWEMFRTIFTNTGEPHILALIGDPKQSIYGFRGTGLQAYNGARNLVPRDSVYRLDTNYRSTPSLVAAANFLFKPLFSSGADGNPVGFEPVLPGRAERKPAAAGPGPAVTFIDVKSLSGVSEAIAAAIREILDPRTGQTSASDIAVLVRGEKEENDIFNRLEIMGIPAVRFRTRSVFTMPQAFSLDGLLRAMDRPRDISLWKAVLSGRYFRIPPAMLLRFEEDGHLDGFVEEGLGWQRLFAAGRSMEAFDSFFRYAAHTSGWAEAAGDGALSASLRSPWPRRVLSEPDGLRQWQDWRHLCELIQNRQAAGTADIQGIRSWMADSASDPDPESSDTAVRLETEAPAVRVMTMHSAKGLEFPLVFLHGGYRGKTRRKSGAVHRFDRLGTLVVDRLGRESTFGRHLAYEWEEDKRLWYVAFTRASERIWIPLLSDGALTQGESLFHQALQPSTGLNMNSGALEPQLPPHEFVTSRNAGDIRDSVRRRIRDLTKSYPDQFALVEGAAVSLPPLTPIELPVPKTVEPPRDRLSLRDPFTGSYTSYVRSAGKETHESSREADDRDIDGHTGLESGEPAADAESLPASSVREPLPLSADRGALFGTLVHSFFEECDFRKAGSCSAEDWFADPEVEELFSKLTRRCYPPDWYRPRARALKSMVFSTLSAPVEGMGRLCDIPENRKRAEVEFLMNIPRDGTFDAGELRLASRRGFLKGYIDLLVEHGGRWWVVDWKTNVPPGRETAEAYDQNCLDGIMVYHHYQLQYELYLLALCRTLSAGSGKPVDWNSQIGGAVYMFVRGTRAGDNRGVFTSKPSLERILYLASAMGLQGVIR